MIDLGSLGRQINRGSKSSEIVLGVAKNFASFEANVENTGEYHLVTDSLFDAEASCPNKDIISKSTGPG